MPGVRNREIDTIQVEGKEMVDKPALVNQKDTIFITGMEYEAQGRFGARFLATLIAPDGNGYHYGFTSAGGNGRTPSPRDLTNKWMRDQIRSHKMDRIPAQLCKRGSAYYLDKPGSESETDGVIAATAEGSATELPDEPPF
jgi:hypothetical protein